MGRRDPLGALVTGPDGIPTLTLGWTVLEWTVEYLRQPDGPDAGAPWRFTPEQVRIVLWWYAIDPRGRFVYRRAVIRRSKGWGKDPLCAALACIEFVGPCRFGGFDAAGDPVAVPHPTPWVQVTAVNLAQTRNTMSLLPGMLSPAAVDDYGIDLGKEIIYARSGGQIQSVTSSPRALEGGRPTLVIANETQHWLATNDGHAMARVARRNLGKSRDGAARLVEITNAHEPGLDSVAEQSYEAHLAMVEGRTRGGGLLYDSREAPPETVLSDPTSLRAGLRAAYGDATWTDLDRLVDEVYDPNTPASESRRFYLNQIAAAEDAWTTATEWDACVYDDQLGPGDVVALGGDFSRTDDATALVLCRLSDGLLAPVGVWERPDGPAGDGWEVPREDVDDMVAHIFGRYRVVAFYGDVAGWESYIDAWSVRYRDQLAVKASPRSVVGWDMRARTGEFTRRGAEATLAAITDRTLRHTGDPVLRRHVLNARRRPNRWGVSFGKEHRESPRKVDALAAGILARLARQDALAAGADGAGERSGEVWAL
ncbi:terminase [Virgisporangium aliadipatigenens]|uniref:terminase n=1 Tax=Virgisporangium aliadipatigenens TaxID=741659 RepID=UPI001EF3D2A2|nr:terminase [Virgisporangium aliadipatigenens]